MNALEKAESLSSYLSTIDKTELLENEMRKMPQVDLPVDHIFAPGIYCRQLKIPKGILLTGKIHKTKHLNILLKGKMKVLIDSELRVIDAPFIVVSPPGTKRIAEALEDCIWLTVHATNETDVDRLEADLVVSTKQEYLEYIGKEPFLPGIN